MQPPLGCSYILLPCHQEPESKVMSLSKSTELPIDYFMREILLANYQHTKANFCLSKVQSQCMCPSIHNTGWTGFE